MTDWVARAGRAGEEMIRPEDIAEIGALPAAPLARGIVPEVMIVAPAGTGGGRRG